MGLDSVELVMAIEEEFDIDIPDGDAEKIQTVGDMQRQVLETLRQLGETPDADSGLSKLRKITVNQIGVRPEQVRPEARWIEDLGLD